MKKVADYLGALRTVVFCTEDLQLVKGAARARRRFLDLLLAQTQPGSLQELADKTGRAKSNLSRTLKTMERYGLVEFEEGHGRHLAPRVYYTDLVLDVPLQRL